MKKRIISPLLATFAVIALVGCDPAAQPPDENTPTDTSLESVMDYGNGVYYFPQDGSRFGNALSEFIADHPDLELVAFADNGKGAFGLSIGHFIVFRNRVDTPPDSTSN
ncbi:MAG: hypothetical protein KJI72_01995 [Patescibacteria group bacterium]|nr:hypothetical protein [Patescibacteria group bacterium]